MLSKGKFKPHFYAFYDGDIIYDSDYGGFNETQNAATDRIKKFSRLKPQHAFESAETRIKKVTQTEAAKQLDYDEKALLLEQHQPTQTRIYGLSGQLGTSRLTSHKAPAWRVNLLSGQINDSVQYATGSMKNELIPQLNVELETTINVVIVDQELDKLDNIDEGFSDSEDLQAYADLGLEYPESFEDGTGFKITHDTIVFDFFEENAERQDMNFDVEVFEIKEDILLGGDNQEFHQLYFKRNAKDLMRDLAIHPDKQPIRAKTFNSLQESKYVDHYIGLNLDASIEATKASSGLSTIINPKIGNPNVPIPGITSIPINSFACPDEIGLGSAVQQGAQAPNTAGEANATEPTTGGSSGGSSGGGSIYSDIRLKHSIRKIGVSKAGISKYLFKYKNDNRLYHGVMAQEIKDTYPSAITIDSKGYYKVDYDLIDVDFYEIKRGHINGKNI